MFLKNYTSDVPVSQTINRIEQTLIRCGVSAIAKEYDPGGKGEIVAITFRIEMAGTPPMSVRLPADKEKACDALWINYADGEKLSADGQGLQYNAYKKKRRRDFAEQAERTAWKIIQDWVEIQMSMIVMKQADCLEVFLPYIWDGKSTVYGRLKESGYRALLPERT